MVMSSLAFPRNLHSSSFVSPFLPYHIVHGLYNLLGPRPLVDLHIQATRMKANFNA